jgi:hypothetical protein
MPLEPEPAFAAGAAVAISNLQSKPELNGTGGTILAWDESKGRYAVDASLSSGRLLLKPTCLLPAAAATTTIDGTEFTLRNDAEFPAALLDELRRRGLTPSDRDHCGLADAPSAWPVHAERSMLLSLEALLLRPGALVGEASAAESVLHASRARLGTLWRRFCQPANEPLPEAPGASSPSSAAFEAWAAKHLPEALGTVAVSPIAGSGLGLLARCALRRGEVAVAVPLPLLLHAAAARQAADEGGALRGLGRALRALQLGAALHDDVLTLVALVLARRSHLRSARGQPATAWGAYAALLGGGFGTALEWDEATLAALAGTPLAVEVGRSRAALEATHAALTKALAREELAALREALGGGVAWEELRWANSLFESRGIVAGVGGAGGGEAAGAGTAAEVGAAAEVGMAAGADEAAGAGALSPAGSASCVVPIGDLLNHSPHAQLQPEVSDGALRFRCMADVPRGAQLFIDYTPLSCAETLHHHGFLPCDAATGVGFEGFSVALELPPDDPHLAAKRALLAARGLGGRHWLRPGGAIGARLRGAVRLGALVASELEASHGGGALPDVTAAPLCFSNEQRCLQLLRTFVEGLLAGLPPPPPPPAPEAGGAAARGAATHPALVYAALQRRTLREALRSVQVDEQRLYSGQWKLPKRLVCTPPAPPATPALIAPPVPAAPPAAASAPDSVPQERMEPSCKHAEPIAEHGVPPGVPSDTAPPTATTASGMRHALSELEGALQLSVELPGVSSLGEIEVGLSATEVVLARRDGVELLRVPMPRPVSAERAVAKFSKRHQRLTVTLPWSEL